MATAALSGVFWHLRSKADSAPRTDDKPLDRFRNDRDVAGSCFDKNYCDEASPRPVCLLDWP
ncbi:MAG: hypothetical protein EXS09_07975 [Gemmataceae bacterium]|nr:hypothetical protein [Gemmataceae bacterium]